MATTYLTTDLIDGLQRSLRRQLEQLDALRRLPLDVLRTRPTPKRWSVLEVVEHMLLSSGHYHRRVARLFADPDSGLRPSPRFTPGRWGHKFTEGMRPGPEGGIANPMRTLWFFEPKPAQAVGLDTLDRFEDMARSFIRLLEEARTRGLEGPRVTSTLGPLFRFKVGDAIAFPVAHQERHFLQIERTLAAVRKQVPEPAVR